MSSQTSPHFFETYLGNKSYRARPDAKPLESIREPVETPYDTYMTALGCLVMQRATYIEMNGEAGIGEAEGIDAETAYDMAGLFLTSFPETSDE